ncbi:MAG: DUF305 domain-containing protein [Sphingomonadales bacterium]
MPRLSVLAIGLIVLLAPAAHADQKHQAMEHSQMQGMGHDQMPGPDHSEMKGMDHSAMEASAQNPYGDAEMKMHNAMMEAVGKDASETWVRKMIAHHQGAIDMANVALAQANDPKVKQKAQETITSQKKEIDELEMWLDTHK